jgi:hypothetical protein
MAKQKPDSVSFFGRTARATARNSWRCLISAIVVATVISVIGLTLTLTLEVHIPALPAWEEMEEAPEPMHIYYSSLLHRV